MLCCCQSRETTGIVLEAEPEDIPVQKSATDSDKVVLPESANDEAHALALEAKPEVDPQPPLATDSQKAEVSVLANNEDSALGQKAEPVDTPPTTLATDSGKVEVFTSDTGEVTALAQQAEPKVEVKPEAELNAEPMPEPEKVSLPDEVMIEFQDSEGVPHFIAFQNKPLGITVRHKRPLKVKEVDPESPAATLGVKPGWIFVRVGETEVASLSLNSAMNVLVTNTDKLPELPEAEPKAEPEEVPLLDEVMIEFQDDKGVLRSNSFQSKPLGISFCNKRPLKVKEVTPESPAARLGVQPGWKFKTVGGTEVTSLALNSAMNVVVTNTDKLPQA